MTALARRHALARELRAIDPTRPDGRKTSRTRKPRVAGTPTHEAPELRVVFRLPPALMVSPGQHPGGVNVTPLGTAEVTFKTFNRDALFERAIGFIRKIAPKGMPPMSFAADFASSSEPGFRMKWWLSIVDGHGFASMSPVGPLIFPAPPR